MMYVSALERALKQVQSFCDENGVKENTDPILRFCDGNLVAEVGEINLGTCYKFTFNSRGVLLHIEGLEWYIPWETPSEVRTTRVFDIHEKQS